MAHIDHVVIAVRSPEQYTEYLLSQFGLAAYHGGRLAGGVSLFKVLKSMLPNSETRYFMICVSSSGIGTESQIVPLGEGFLDLVSIADAREANSNPLGRYGASSACLLKIQFNVLLLSLISRPLLYMYRAVLAATEETEAKIISWAINTGDSVQPLATRLDLPANPLKRALPDGGHASCRVVGLQQAGSFRKVPSSRPCRKAAPQTYGH